MLENLSNRLFWDVDPNSLDWERDMPLIITRVVERGTVAEWKTILHKYGCSIFHSSFFIHIGQKNQVNGLVGS